jgi:hypothetical protein
MMAVPIYARSEVILGAAGLATGLGTVYLVSHLPFRQGTAIGPAYLPTFLGYAVAGLSAFILIRGIRLANPGRFVLPNMRAAVCLLCAVIFFGLVIQPLGLAIASAGAVVLAALAVPGVGIRTLAPLGVLAPALAIVVFVFLLKLPVSVWP